MERVLKNAERSEEIQHIIEKMPTGFGIKVTVFVLILVACFFGLGWIIKYPDVITGSITVDASDAPIKLISSASGKLTLNNFRNFGYVNEGDWIGYIQNPANIEDVQKISRKISSLNIKNPSSLKQVNSLPRNVSLGELNIKYFSFLDAYIRAIQYKNANVFNEQDDVLKNMIAGHKKSISIYNEKLQITNKNLNLIEISHRRDSILLSKKVLSQAEHDRSEMSVMAARDAYQNLLKEISSVENQIGQAEKQILQNSIQSNEKDKQLDIELITTFTELEMSIKAWEQKYVFKAPMKGKVQFVKFWKNNQFIQQGEPVFTVLPVKNKVVGQMTLPSTGAGKVKVGQEVIIKLDNFPYTEYGTIAGVVSSISLIPNPVSTGNGTIDNYLVNVDLPHSLKTNYGSTLAFKYESKGTGDIITNSRRLIQRLFDNLNYKLNQ